MTPLWLAPAIQGLDDARMPQVFLHFIHSVQTSFDGKLFSSRNFGSGGLPILVALVGINIKIVIDIKTDFIAEFDIHKDCIRLTFIAIR